MSALWTPPTVSYAAMVSSTETMASTSAAGVTHLSYLPPGMPPLEAMDTLLAPTMENLLATAGVIGAMGHGLSHEYPLPLASVRQDLGCLNSRCLLPEGRKRHK